MVFEAPERTTVPPGGEATLQLVVTRLDNGEAPLELRAVDSPAGLMIEPNTIRPGATQASLKISASGPGPYSVMIEGVADGKVLGRTAPISVEVRAGRPRNEDRSNDN